MSPPTWAYQVDSFDPAPDEELVCSICHSVFCDPVQSPCNHVFCRNCITKWLERNRNCPICRRRIIRYAIQEVVPLIRNMIMKLSLRCHNSERGCESKFTLEACEAHVKECVYEMIQCKNKPCKQMILRRDMNDHELHDCSHRYVQCKKCGLKISLVIPQKHDCVKALKQCLKDKMEVIKKKKQKIKDLQSEIKTLKDNEQRHSDSSSIDSIGEAAIMMNLNDMSSLSSGSSVSSTSYVSNSEADETASFWSPDTFAILDGLERRYHNSPEELVVDDDSIEYPRESSPYPRESNLRAATDSAASSNPSDLSNGEDIPVRRPAKRRLPSALLDSSDDEQHELVLPPLPSPKRVWRLYRRDGGEPPASGLSTSTFEAAGPSSEPSTSAGNDNLTTVDPSAPTAPFTLRPRFRRREQAEGGQAAAAAAAASIFRNIDKTFERTKALLSRYNLESDPEWVPPNSDTLENDSDCSLGHAARPRDGYITSSDESSLSDSNSDSSPELTSAKQDMNDMLFANVFSSSDDDPDYQPN